MVVGDESSPVIFQMRWELATLRHGTPHACKSKMLDGTPFLKALDLSFVVTFSVTTCDAGLQLSYSETGRRGWRIRS